MLVMISSATGKVLPGGSTVQKMSNLVIIRDGANSVDSPKEYELNSLR